MTDKELDRRDEEADEDLLRLARAADPIKQGQLDDWAESEAGRRVYSRILALREGVRSAPPRPRRIRMSLAMAATAIVVIAIVTGVVVGTRDWSSVAVDSTSVTSIASEKAADRVAALYRVVELAETVRGGSVEGPPLSPNDASAIAERAELMGIITPEERNSVIASGPVGRGEYCLWLWRALGALLPPVRKGEFTDLDSLSAEEREAILGVARAAILDGRADGRFEPDRSLTEEEEQEALRRLETVFSQVPE